MKLLFSKKIFNKTDYYNKTYELLISNFENYIQQSGLDEDVLKDIVSKTKNGGLDDEDLDDDEDDGQGDKGGEGADGKKEECKQQ